MYIIRSDATGEFVAKPMPEDKGRRYVSHHSNAWIFDTWASANEWIVVSGRHTIVEVDERYYPGMGISRGGCSCGSGEEAWWEYDARGIELAKVCSSCKEERLKGYRGDVLTDSNYWADEAIEPEDY
jgi:hypothetical protein|tara:strand:+ start:617 stop:997 length:381 start_codon:yes stop_codon:yes gene_type:complete